MFNNEINVNPIYEEIKGLVINSRKEFIVL